MLQEKRTMFLGGILMKLRLWELLCLVALLALMVYVLFFIYTSNNVANALYKEGYNCTFNGKPLIYELVVSNNYSMDLMTNPSENETKSLITLYNDYRQDCYMISNIHLSLP